MAFGPGARPIAKGKKTGGRDFEPGRSGNPHGRPALPEDVKEARSITRLEFERTMNRYLFMKPDELAAVVEERQVPILDLLCASISMKAVQEGCQHRTDFILTRMIGKAPERTEESDVRKPIILAYRLDDEEFE